MRGASLFLPCLLWSLVEVHSQTEHPYVSFMGEILPNYSFVNLSLVGNDSSGSDSVQCHTDLDTCCGDAQGNHRGNWIPPAKTTAWIPPARIEGHETLILHDIYYEAY